MAERHGIPSIDLAGPIAEAAVEAGDLTDEELFRDSVHTTPAGSQLVAEAAADAAFGQVAALEPVPAPAEPPAGLDRGYARAHVATVDPADGGGAGSMGLFRMHRPYLELGRGEVLCREFDEHLAGLVVLAGPESGEIQVTDESGIQTEMIWDAACHYERFTTVTFDRMIPPGRKFAIELTDTVPDYATCQRPVEPPAHRVLRTAGYLLLPA